MIIAGGCYLEVCTVPRWRRLFGSGGRAAAAVGRLSPGTVLHTYAHRTWVPDVVSSLHAFGVTASVRPIDQRISFSYFHPLSPALLEPAEPTAQAPLAVSGDIVLRFGFVEGDAVVEARRAVHDPQTGQAAQAFRANGSRAETLAVVLNQGEAEVATGAAGDDVGAALLAAHRADVVVVKRGCEGARVFRAQGAPADIPAYRSERVFKIGSGDVFSAAFAHHWGERGLEPAAAADLASRHVAHFVDYHALPLPAPAELGAQAPSPPVAGPA
ncbi:PfkB family carbohydrate kinase [Methylobacterium durans]|uniref:PfkB family carbohydrate kinase n=1 Tax=Methylobacterium durans TaxID=2202825 RepID=UPI001F1FB0D3|nr:PfkB family carbohydrate kinase [Methylobacterium durans]